MFATLEAARELKLKEKADFMHELVGIAATPNQSVEYVKGLQNFYSQLSSSAINDLTPKRKETPGARSVDWETASRVMWSAMQTKKRLESGR